MHPETKKARNTKCARARPRRTRTPAKGTREGRSWLRRRSGTEHRPGSSLESLLSEPLAVAPRTTAFLQGSTKAQRILTGLSIFRVSAYMGWIESVCGENCSLPVATNADLLRAELNEIVSLKSATGTPSKPMPRA